MNNIKEIVFTNGGEIYKTQTSSNMASMYRFDGNAVVYGKVDGSKKYVASQLLLAAMHPGVPTPVESAYIADGLPDELVGYSDRLLYAAAGVDSTEYGFKVTAWDDVDSMVSKLSLVDPVDATIRMKYPDISKCSFGYSDSLSYYTFFVLVVENGKVVRNKLYLYPKAFDQWHLWMGGKSFSSKGELVEKGTVLATSYYKDYDKIPSDSRVISKKRHSPSSTTKQLEVIRSNYHESSVRCFYSFDSRYSVFSWVGTLMDAERKVVDTKWFHPSKFALRFFAGSNVVGKDYEEINPPSSVMFWMGHATHEKEVDKKEYFFATFGGTGVIDAVAAHYGLDVPYSEEQGRIIREEPEKFRARHYDLFSQGEGNATPVVVCSVVFKGDKPVDLLLYTFCRPWETEEDCEVAKDYDYLKRVIEKEIASGNTD